MTQPEPSMAHVIANHIQITPPHAFSLEFLQTVVDALPEALAVIDRQYNVVLANRAAREESESKGGSAVDFKCFSCFHRRSSPCEPKSDHFESEHGACPLQRVVATKTPTRVYHTHYDADQREVSVAVDAAPIFDQSGEVAYIVETCRDVTERCLSRHLCRIGNRHMKMKPLLDEYARDIGRFVRCERVRIHVLDEQCAVCGAPANNGNGTHLERKTVDNADCDHCTNDICIRHLRKTLRDALPPATSFGSLRFDRFSEFLSRIPVSVRARLAACTWSECESVALVPIRLTDADLGLLHVADPHPNAISDEMVESLERLSLDLGAAIHRVRIEEELLRARSELETRVRERTEELTQSNRALQKEISERVRLEREILQAGVREQQRIGQELHDGVGQELTGMAYLAQNLLMTLKAQNVPGVEMAAELAHGIPNLLGQIQQIVRGLVPLEIGAADLELALEILASTTERQTGLKCQFCKSGGDLMEDDDVPIQLYRIAQEAIANAVKHSRAQQINIELYVNEEIIRLEVKDDGIGIQPGAENGPGIGLRSMRYRARAIGGELTTRQRSQGGTTVECSVPRVSSPNHG